MPTKRPGPRAAEEGVGDIGDVECEQVLRYRHLSAGHQLSDLSRTCDLGTVLGAVIAAAEAHRAGRRAATRQHWSGRWR